MKRMLIWGSLPVFGLAAHLGTNARANPTTTKPTHKTTAESPAQSRAYLHRFFSWMNAPWQGNDRFFAQERKDIEASIQSGQNPADLVKQYESDAKKYPSAPTVQFRYYYAAYESGIKDHTVSGYEASNIRLGDMHLFDLGVTNGAANTYNYVRLEFLCVVFSDPVGYYTLKDVGARLLAKDPSDFNVKFALTELLSVSRNPTDNVTAVKYSLEMASQYPSNPRVFGMLGYAYYAEWRRSHNQADAANAITAYQHYLNLEPSDSYYRTTAQGYIDQIRKSE